MKIAVIGAGAWGTALAIAFARGASHQVTLWARDPALCARMQALRENAPYLPGQTFPDALVVRDDFPATVDAAELLLLATPLAGLRPILRQWRGTANAVARPFLWLCKGLEAETGLLPHQIVAEELNGWPALHGALTGPSFAEEVARGLPAAVTLASADAGFARAMAQELSGARLRIYANDDVIGAEVGGAVKNVLAIASGISDGLGLGHNARAALITRGLAEIVRFGLALGARRETLMGLAGMGDLILTCTGDLSRNRRVGLALAAGRTLADSVRELGHVAEGVYSARAVARRAAELQVEMPIVQAVCAVLDGQLSAAAAVDRLMQRDPKDEC
ncbi:glycerol-3-phosphate dehydrogenase (NAD+) [Sterolibacterium denitrificans]|uniref:Glycerol-3-phosphate dehydrogenase [NAD(P)+] n=1 Tax=Sterolibacterium denitrificans TaxID=157592 RepID=A0A7Z7HQE7_9PROT|nr:NAD(P)H-dependent glycerol-3-phosphate dehydrogenase [Sterolibacterium denitrificans]SMB24055.1 glycerol-3-phosphate dehydrogenase (NAD+) [Sterolibacterium denitrificans]